MLQPFSTGRFQQFTQSFQLINFIIILPLWDYFTASTRWLTLTSDVDVLN